MPTLTSAATLLQSLLRAPSVTPDEAGTLQILEDFLTPLGFTCTRLTFEGDGSYPVQNLFASRGSGGKHLLFAGHTDVVAPGPAANWTHPPFAADIADECIIGRGAVDMKGGIAAWCEALATCVASGDADKGTLSLAITCDEEADAVNGTEKLMAWADERGHVFDFALVGEPSSDREIGDRIKSGRRGSYNAKVIVTGQQGHVAYPEFARNPLPVAAEIATALANLELDKGTDAFPPSNLELTNIASDNGATNIIPDAAEIAFNIRFNDIWTPEALTDRLQILIGSVAAKGTKVTLITPTRVAACFLAPPGEALSALQDAIAVYRGAPAQLSTTGGTSDGRFIARYCPVVECGLVGRTMHKTDETVPLADLSALSTIYAGFISRFLGD